MPSTRLIRSTHALGLVMSVIALATVACEDKPPSDGDILDSPRAESPSSSAPPTPKAKAPDNSLQAVEAVASKCTLGEDHIPASCSGGELKALQKLVGKQRMKALPGLMDALEHEDTAVQQVAGFAFKAYVPYVLGDAAELDYTIRGDDKRVAPIDTKLSQRIIARAMTYKPDTDHMARFTLDAAIDMGTLAGLDDEVRALIKRFDPNKNKTNEQLFYQGMKRVMRFGRMRYFEETSALATHTIPSLQLTAFEAPLLMNTWNNGESDTICAWAGEMMRKDRPTWNAGPARLMLRCNKANTWRNILLDEATRRYNAGALTRSFNNVLCRVCVPAIHNQYPAAGKTVCDRGEALFARMTTDTQKNLGSEERKQLLQCMLNQWSDTPSLEHLATLKNDRDPGVAKLASKLLETHSPKKADSTK